MTITFTNWNTVPVRGTFVGTDGYAIYGSVSFTPQSHRFVDGAEKVIVVGRTITEKIDPDEGTVLVHLAATDDMDINGMGFTWHVQENFVNGLSYDIVVPVAAETVGIDLATAITVPPDLGTNAADYTATFQHYVDLANAEVQAASGFADDSAASAVESAGYAQDSADSAASVVREQPNGVAGLDANGVLYTTRFPPAYQREVSGGVAGLDANGLIYTNRLPSNLQREVNGGVAGLDTNGLIYTSRIPATMKTDNGNQPVGQGELILNVMDYGAVGDGVVDDGPAIQAALTAATASATIGPAVVWLPSTPKGYRVGVGLSLPRRVTLRGERRVRLRRTGAGSAMFINMNAVRGCTIENLTIDDSLGLTPTAIVRASAGTKDYTIRNCKFIGGVLGTSRAVISKKIISNVATIEVDEPHGLEVGSIIHLSQIDSTFDGDWTLTAVTNTAPYTVQFAITAADVSQGTAKNPVPVYDGWLNGETRRDVKTKASSGNTITIETTVPHGYTSGQWVYVTGVEGQNDGGADVTMNAGEAKITVTDPTHFTYVTGTHPDVATTASTGTIGHDTQSLNSTNGFAANAIDHQNGITGGLIENCWFEGMTNSIRIPDAQRVTAQHNLFTNWTSRCFYIIGQATSATEDLMLIGNRVRDMHIGGDVRQAITFQGTNDTYAHKRTLVAFNSVVGVNKSWTAKDPGGADQISLQRCEDFRVIGNYSGFGGDLGFNASAQCRRGIFANNIAEHNDTAGINIGAQAALYVRDITITGNTIMNNGQNRNGDRGYTVGISVAGFGQRIMINGNVLSDDQATHTQTTCIRLQSCTDSTIGTNQMYGYTSQYYIDAASTNTSVPGIGQSTTSAGTFTFNANVYTKAKITAQAVALTIANPTGTPYQMQPFVLRIKDNGTARAITYGSQFRAVGTTLPTTTVANKTLYLGFTWNSDDTKWDCIAVAQEV